MTIDTKVDYSKVTTYSFVCNCECFVERKDEKLYPWFACSLHENMELETLRLKMQESVQQYNSNLEHGTLEPVCSICRERHRSDDRHVCE